MRYQGSSNVMLTGTLLVTVTVTVTGLPSPFAFVAVTLKV